MTGKFTVRYGVVAGKRCYRWECPVCGSGGAHRFDRWTDYARRRRPDVHPWRRCLDAIDMHVCGAHRDLIRLHTEAVP